MSKRLVVHVIAAILFWILFGYYWWLVSRRQVTVETLHAVRALVLITAAVWVLTTLWMEHNRRKYGRRPDRRTRRKVAEPLAHEDTLGRPVMIQGDDDLSLAAYVEIDIDELTDAKRYRALDPPPAGAGS